MKRKLRALLIAAVAIFLLPLTLTGQSNLVIKGLGFFGDRKLAARLSFLHGVDPRDPVVLDAALVEDTAFLLLEQLKRKGYLEPAVTGVFSIDGETVREVRWSAPDAVHVETDFIADHAVFRCEPGILHYYESATVTGVEAIPTERVGRFFIPEGVLVNRKSGRIFTRENFRRRTGRLLEELRSLGFRDARMTDEDIHIDAVSGAVEVRLAIEQGPLHRVGTVEVVQSRRDAPDTSHSSFPGDVPFTREWERNERQRLRNEAYTEGYPDTQVTMQDVNEHTGENGDRVHDVRFHVDRKSKVTLSGVRFSGDLGTRRTVLRRQARLDPGEPLDRIEAAEGRGKLISLGIFKEVEMELEPPGEDEREIVYTLVPGWRKEFKVLVGWGSYEQARAGFEWRHRNPWGLAHRYEVGIKQSVKASGMDGRYSVPRILGTGMTGYFSGRYSYREELSFDRERYGIDLGVSTFLADRGISLSFEYGYNKENADRNEFTDFASRENATVGSLTLQADLERRDDVFAPTSGYHLYARTKTASELLGGNVDFQKLEFGGSIHFAITGSTIAHLGLAHGVLFSNGESVDNIPFNERFFPGGENSVRGYREGGASPLDSSGDEVGAESYVRGNVEIEQRLLQRLSAVAFFDWTTVSRDGWIDDDGEFLYSVGLGLRYQTVVGPVRLEYGHNPDPRDDDPDGTVHFSIGFPF